jgi:hypothetical protein
MKALIALLACQLVPGQPIPPAAPLFLAIKIDQYIAETYAERPVPPAEFIFFTGEPIRYRFVAVNQEHPTLIVKFPRRVEAAVEVDNETEYDNAPIDMQRPPASLTVKAITRLANGMHAFPLAGEEVVSLEHNDRIEWRFELNERFTPGMYRVPVRFTGHDSEGRRLVIMVHEMRFEVRDAAKHPAEVLVREAYYNIGRDGNEARARNALTRLQQINPNSVAVFALLSLMESERGNTELARQFRERAAEIEKKGLDTLLLKYCDPACMAMRRHGGVQ